MENTGLVTVHSLKRTCNCCPSQWEGMTDDGRVIYIRYRYGYLSVQISLEPSSHLEDALKAPEFCGGQIGDSLDGTLSYELLIFHTEKFLILPENESL